MTWLDNFDERQRKEIELCRIYAKDFNHGTDGHNAKMIIAKMSKLLDGLEEVAVSKMPPVGATIIRKRYGGTVHEDDDEGRSG
jgi:hypothetical protein